MIDQMAFIPLASPDIRDQDINEVIRVLKSGMLIQGPEVEKLERAIASYLKVKNCIAVSNGTATLHISLLASGIGEGDEVIVPSFSYVATANVVELTRATPIFVDIDIDTFNIDVQKIEAAITARTKAIIPVHEFGLACNIQEILEISKKHDLVVIEDAACALGAKDHGNYVGSFGQAGSFSFHPRKAITSGEGGLIATNDDIFCDRARILRNHGIDTRDGLMNFVDAGFNYRMTDFQAALVNSQFKRIDNILSYKNELAEIYLNEIKNPMIKLPIVPEGKIHSWQTFHILLDDKIRQKDTIERLKLYGIGSNYGAQCIPYMQYYANKYKLNCEVEFPISLKAYKNGLALPLYEKLSKDQIFEISKVINKITN